MDWISELALPLAGTVLASVWAVAKAHWLADALRNRRLAKAVHVGEAAVAHTYEHYVRERKRAAADGKLTDAERRIARQRAKDMAVAYGREQGVDVLRELGESGMNLLITKLVKALKR